MAEQMRKVNCESRKGSGKKTIHHGETGAAMEEQRTINLS